MSQRSHPHPNSSLVDHGRSVAGHMKAILKTNLTDDHIPAANFLSDVTGLCHDLLKDTRAFQLHLDGKPSCKLSYHSGGGALFGYLLAEKILNDKKKLLKDYSLRSVLPHIVFSVAAAHHGEIKAVDICGQHKDAIEHWRATRSEASKILIKDLCNRYQARNLLSDLDDSIQKMIDNFDFKLSRPPIGNFGEIFFDTFLLTRMCLGAIAIADAQSASIQSNGGKEPEKFIFEPKISEFSVQIPMGVDYDNPLNILRTAFQDKIVENHSTQAPGLLLKAPTGLGKTIGVSRLVEKIHLQNGGSKVFYIAPTVVILNQTAPQLFSMNQNNSNMLLHYLAREFNEYDDRGCLDSEEIDRRLRAFSMLDAGLVVTTYHRVISILSGLRKNQAMTLTSLKNSIWIFDESQFLSHIQYPLFISICSSLNRLCNATPIFMSATPQSVKLWENAHNILKWQSPPLLHPLLNHRQVEEMEKNKFVDGRRHILPKPEIESLDRLADEIQQFRKNNPKNSVLVLLNLAKDVIKLWQNLGKEGYAITNYLRPIDVKRNLEQAAEKLIANEPILVIATSIVQAGVDLDFDAGFVDLNDLRTFRQGCGRIGRNYIENRGSCPVFAFELKDSKNFSSWFRQRFHNLIRQATPDPVAEIYKEIISRGIDQVLNMNKPLLDSEIALIEETLEDDINLIFRKAASRLLPFMTGYSGRLFQISSEQGFEFKPVWELLMDDIQENDSASPFLVIFTSEDEEALQDFYKMEDGLKALGEKLSVPTDHFFKTHKKYRQKKEDLMRYISAYAIRRMDVSRDASRGDIKGKIYEEMDFLLLIHPAQYDANQGGWQIGLESSKGQEGIIW
jgi:CRISPR/Cas system-associated endonuclease/helicase Cas3